ncbi:MAG: SIR2 family protein [Fusobacteriaceae bacterium]|nr:SIR2 family protein [Fusobacteriaceae bacterium]MBN2837896.1 SIR2 family protein [Fusobacteriaceae bacterium]
MKYEHIEDLAYYMKQAKENGQNKPIVFLGAGASKTGNIPLANEIVEKIKNEYDTPKIKRLDEKDITYAKLMECLTPFERNTLLKSYIDNGKINVTHLYLANLMKEDYIDYVLTVNFDNLMLRALSLYNIFPPTYDMAVLKDFTTTTFEKGSVVYLHGQHHGLWLLNTQEEMAKVYKVIPPILNKLADKRPWIFIGYSGEDPIFNHILDLGRFDNGLYWVQYRDYCPSDKVCNNLLKKENTNAFVIKDYDADSFMVTLSNHLGLIQPEIIDKPFSVLYKQLHNINDINDEKYFKHVKERLEIAKLQVNDAINQFESGKVKTLKEIKSSTKLNLLKKKLLNLTFETDFDEEFVSVFNSLQLAIEKLDSHEFEELRVILAEIFFNWAMAETNIEESILKYSEAIKYDSSNPS